jgi:hypothetical protein
MNDDKVYVYSDTNHFASMSVELIENLNNDSILVVSELVLREIRAHISDLKKLLRLALCASKKDGTNSITVGDINEAMKRGQFRRLSREYVTIKLYIHLLPNKNSLPQNESDYYAEYLNLLSSYEIFIDKLEKTSIRNVRVLRLSEGTLKNVLMDFLGGIDYDRYHDKNSGLFNKKKYYEEVVNEYPSPEIRKRGLSGDFIDAFIVKYYVEHVLRLRPKIAVFCGSDKGMSWYFYKELGGKIPGNQFVFNWNRELQKKNKIPTREDVIIFLGLKLNYMETLPDPLLTAATKSNTYYINDESDHKFSKNAFEEVKAQYYEYYPKQDRIYLKSEKTSHEIVRSQYNESAKHGVNPFE